MKKILSGIILMLFCQLLIAQPAIYRDELLIIPHVVVIDSDTPLYYNNIQLRDDGNGSFSLKSADSRNLVAVGSVDILILESFPVQALAVVSGNKSTPCVELEPPAVSRKENVFTVVLAETQPAADQACMHTYITTFRDFHFSGCTWP